MPRNVKLLSYLTAGLAPCLVTMAVPAVAADEVFSATAAVTIPGVPMNSWDISFVDPSLGQFFLADRTHNAVDVVNTGSNSFAGFIGQGLFTGTAACGPALPGRPAPGANDCRGPDGVLTTNHTELWVGDGDSTVKVFDLTNPAHPLTHTIPTGGKFRADEMCFDPEQQLVMVANNSQGEADGPFATIISVKTHTVVKNIFFDGTKGAPLATNGAEQCQWSSRTERFYITIPGVENPDNGHGVVAVINPEDLDDKKLVEKVFDIPKANCDTPQGAAAGPDHQLLIGCNGNGSTTQSSVIIDQRNGHIIATIANESGPDEVWFNPGDGQYFLARSSAVGGQFLGVIDARGPQADQSVAIAPSGNPTSHSVAADPVKNQVYLAIGANKGTICTSAGGDSSKGCIAVFTTTNDDKCLAEGAPIREANAGEDPVFMNGKCRDNDRHDHDDER